MKIGFLIEQDFINKHFGVRNFFTTIKKSLSLVHETEYITCVKTHSGNTWYRCLPSEENIDIKTCWVNLEQGKITSADFRKATVFENDYPYKKQYYYFQYLGQDIASENYDIIIITNPWLVDLDINISAKKIIGLVYDFVANTYYLQDKCEIGFSNQHYIGYKFFNKVCSKILTDSNEIKNQYEVFFKIEKNKVDYLKPFLPYEFKDAYFSDSDKKENAIILAAPFDLRKGLKKIPGILNFIKNEFDILYIFGMPRCLDSDFNEFWNQLNVKNIKYAPRISYSDLIELYKKSKFLLFPSLEEGLGIPILEAQACGCRVITTNAAPMKDLIVDGAYLLTGDLKIDGLKIKEMLHENFDYKLLSMKSKERFSYEDIFVKVTGENRDAQYNVINF